MVVGMFRRRGRRQQLTALRRTATALAVLSGAGVAVLRQPRDVAGGEIQRKPVTRGKTPTFNSSTEKDATWYTQKFLRSTILKGAQKIPLLLCRGRAGRGPDILAPILYILHVQHLDQVPHQKDGIFEPRCFTISKVV